MLFVSSYISAGYILNDSLINNTKPRAKYQDISSGKRMKNKISNRHRLNMLATLIFVFFFFLILKTDGRLCDWFANVLRHLQGSDGELLRIVLLRVHFLQYL